MNKRMAKKKLKMLEKQNEQIATNALKAVKNKVEQSATEQIVFQIDESKIKEIIQYYKKALKILYGLNFTYGTCFIIITAVMIYCFESYIKTKNTTYLLCGFFEVFCAALNAGYFVSTLSKTFCTYKDYSEAKRIKSYLTR